MTTQQSDPNPLTMKPTHHKTKHKPTVTENVITNLCDMFIEPGSKPAFKGPALELLLVLEFDPTAATDLIKAIGCDSIKGYSKGAVNQVFETLESLDSLERRPGPPGFDGIDMRFNATPLLNILKAMPNRDARTGLSLSPITKNFPGATTKAGSSSPASGDSQNTETR